MIYMHIQMHMYTGRIFVFSVDNLGHPLGQAYSHYRILEMTPRKILYIGDFMKNGPQLWSFF